VKKSKVTQQVEVGDGLALGTLAAGIDAITANKLSIDFAFGYAWRRWTYSARYPQVKGDVARNDFYYQIAHPSERRLRKRAVWIVERGYLYPEVWSESDTALEALESLAEASAIPVQGWQQLADLFLGHLKDDEKFVYPTEG